MGRVSYQGWNSYYDSDHELCYEIKVSREIFFEDVIKRSKKSNTFYSSQKVVPAAFYFRKSVASSQEKGVYRQQIKFAVAMKR